MRASCLLLIFVPACCNAPDGVRALIDHQKWTVLSDSEDPFIANKPQAEPCVAEAFGYELFAEEPSFTVRSQGCAYITVAQPVVTSCCAGETVHLRFWHYNLSNIDGASEAVAAVALDGQTIWEETFPIPSPSGLSAPYIELESELAEGTRMEFHLRNHGMNSWNLIEVSAGATPPE
jgi:hypothetical protein